jgi:glutathione S-transferase
MREICKSGLMSGEGKRGVATMAQATAPFLDSTAYLASPRRTAFNQSGIFRHYPELDP